MTAFRFNAMDDKCLEGDHLKIERLTLLKHVNKRVQYLRTVDIDTSGRGYFFPRFGTIERIFGRQVVIDGNWYPISSIKEMVLAEK